MCHDPSLEGDPTGIGPEDIAKAFEKDRFAGPAWAQYREDTAAGNLKAYSLEHRATVESLVEILHLENEIGGSHTQTKKELMT